MHATSQALLMHHFYWNCCFALDLNQIVAILVFYCLEMHLLLFCCLVGALHAFEGLGEQHT